MDDRRPDAAPSLYRNRKLALMSIVGGVVVGYLIGVPMSFVTTSKSTNQRPWEPFDMVISGSIWALVITIFTVLVAFLMHRYVSLYRNGQRVVSTVVAEKLLPGNKRGVVLQFTHSSNEVRFSYMPTSELLVGAQTTTIVGPPMSNLVLNQNDPFGYSRGSALTQAQIDQVLSGGVAA
jgi:hypothetical protein